MLTLNRAACEAMLRFDVHGCTDVTGFGLIGHAREMALASGVTLEIEVDSVRFLPGAVEYARQGAVPGGLKNNREFASCAVEARARTAARNRRPALRSADFRRPADLAAGRRDAAELERLRWRARTASAACCRGGEKAIRAHMKHNPIIVALDVESAAEARALVARLGTQVDFYKVGMELYAAAGMEFVRELTGEGKDVFLDLKFYDIPETVKRAVAQVARDRRALSHRARGGPGDARGGGRARRFGARTAGGDGAHQLRTGGSGRPGLPCEHLRTGGAARAQGHGSRGWTAWWLAAGSRRGARAWPARRPFW